MTCTLNSDANLRSGPATSYEVLTAVPAGFTVTVHSYANGWSCVTWGDTTGYISNSLINGLPTANGGKGGSSSGSTAGTSWYGGHDYSNVYDYSYYRSQNADLRAAFRPIIYAVYAIAWLAECIGVVFVFGYLPHSWAYYDDFTRAGIYNQAREAPLLIKASRDGNIQQLTYYIKGYPLECWEDNRTRIESALNVTILSITQGSNNQLFELRVVAGCNLMGRLIPWADTYMDDSDTKIVLGINAALFAEPFSFQVLGPYPQIQAAAAIAFGQFLGIGHNAAANALAAGFFQKEQAGQAHGPRGGEIQRKIADWIAAQIDHEIIHGSAVDLIIRQNITLVLFRQGAGYFGGQLGVMLNKNFFRQLADLLNVAGFGHLLVGGFHGEPP